MTGFRYGHASHPDWRMALELSLAQVQGQSQRRSESGQASRPANLGIVYASPHFAREFDQLVDTLRLHTGIQTWVGATGHGVLASNVEYGDEPAVALMLAELPPGGFRIFSEQEQAAEMLGRRRPGLFGHCALVHADPSNPYLPRVLQDLALETDTGLLFGGVVSGEGGGFTHVANEALTAGLSGVMFDDRVAIRSRVSQGCAPLSREHVVSECSSHFICALDGQPALDVLLTDLDLPADARRSRDGNKILSAMPSERLREGLFIGLAGADQQLGRGFGNYLVRNLVGIDPQNRLLAVAGTPQVGDRVVFCTRDSHAARQDLIRVCTELRDELEEDGLVIKGALYHSCVARGANLFGQGSVELGLLAHNLGDVPLIGFQANGEIFRDQIYGHSAVLTLFV